MKKEEHKYTFKMIKLDDILKTGDLNIRKVNGYDDLLASIKAHGIINPVTVVPIADGYKLIAGFRRCWAAAQLEMEKVPCHVYDIDEKNIDEIPITENISRMDMTPVEECLAVAHLINKKNTPKTVARKFGKSLRWVLVRKKIADAGQEALDKLQDGKLTLSAAAKLADLTDDEFKNVVHDNGYINEDTIEGILEHYHLDLEKAPFDTSKCKKCEDCSACQTDLFENEPKAYCLKPSCYAKKSKEAAKATVKKLQAEGKNARIGKFESWGPAYDDEAYNYAVKSYMTDKQKEVEEKGIPKRILVDGESGKTYEYYDMRDLPDFHEESEEERKERLDAENKERDMNGIRWNLHKDKMQEAIEKVCSRNVTALVALLFMNSDDCEDLLSEDKQKEFGYVEDENETMPDFFELVDKMKLTPDSIQEALLESTENLFGNLYYNIDKMKTVYKLIVGKDPEKLKPSEKEVEAAYEKEQAEKEQSEEENSDE